MAWLWVTSCGLLLFVVVLLLSPRSCRARRTLRGLFMARSRRLLFRIGFVRGSGGMRVSERRARWEGGLRRRAGVGLRGLGDRGSGKSDRRDGLEKPLIWGC